MQRVAMTFAAYDSSPALGVRVEDGVCLIDLTGQILAADGAISHWLASRNRYPASLADLVGHDSARDILSRLAGGDDEFADSRLQIQRLKGMIGDLALVTLHRAAVVINYDPLTGLADRRAISNRVASWRLASADASAPFAVLFVDLDDFKRVNDEHGHAVGDKVLAVVAQRLAHCVREGDLVARYGGDEFVMLLKNLRSIAEAELVMERLRWCVSEAIDVGNLELQLTATIGVAISDPQRQIEELIDAADRDMYARKRRRPK
jgi:diguanylate cyclase (GGDEF)-like protein